MNLTWKLQPKISKYVKEKLKEQNSSHLDTSKLSNQPFHEFAEEDTLSEEEQETIKISVDYVIMIIGWEKTGGGGCSQWAGLIPIVFHNLSEKIFSSTPNVNVYIFSRLWRSPHDAVHPKVEPEKTPQVVAKTSSVLAKVFKNPGTRSPYIENSLTNPISTLVWPSSQLTDEAASQLIRQLNNCQAI